MAHIYPTPLPDAILDDPMRSAERRLCKALAARLDDRCRVFFGVAWLSRRSDGRLRDGEVDLVVLDPRRGVLLIEVKGGQIARHAATSAWTSTDRSGTRHDIRNPIAQVVESKHALLEKIRQYPAWRGRWLPVAHGVAFPDCAVPDAPLAPDCPPDIVIAGPDLARIEARVEAIFAAFGKRTGANAPLDHQAVEVITSVLAPSFTLKTPLGVALAEDDRQILTLSEDQIQVLDLTSRIRRAAIGGGAGTGKTLLAAEKARRLATEGFRVLLTCFNKPLGDFLRASLGPVPGLDVMHFHQFCHDFARDAGVPIPDAPLEGPSSAYFDRFPGLLVEALDRTDRRYDAIIVDEGQDFAETWWDALRLCFADDESGILFVFYDDHQRLYQPRTALPPGLTEILLTRNHRNTRAIHEAAARFYRGPRLDTVGPTGQPVETIAATSRDEFPAAVGRVLHRLIHEERVPTHEVAVLTGCSLERSAVGSRARLAAYTVTHDPEAGPGRVLVQSVHRFKGLERQAVVLTDLESLTPERHDRILYTGMTRGRTHLSVVATPDTLERLGMARSQEGQP